ncbi:MAG: alpha/beta fold hydrolase [Myxococcales bacterium]|nr:alpha/beta fold hydrolase [Myxococcales bacterium]MDH3485905.1 alpha/beta fold hydrolase [Myxococcales bacterium]
MSLRGHFWTLAPFLRHTLVPPRAPQSTEWVTRLEDGVIGTLSLNGRLSQTGASDTLIVIVHGLGGSATSYYAVRAAQAAARTGLDSLRLNLRGADRRGEDFYHAGLIADLEATLRSKALHAYQRILLLGYSLGGNLVLRYLAHDPDPRVRAAAVVCAPIDLEKGARAIDKPHRAFYRLHMLRGLKEIYREVAARRDVPLPVGKAMRIDTLEQWDEEVISPRHGFGGAEDYWAKTSACTVLGDIETPTLFVAAEQDPMVLIEAVRPWLAGAKTFRRVITNRGGHVGFPERVDLGIGTSGTVDEQIIRWMLAPT